MRDGHEERALELLGLRELRDHPSEPLAQERDLVRAPRLRDLHVVPARRDVFRRAGEHAHRLRQPSREPQEEQPGERDADREREREPAEERQPLLAQLRLRLRDDEPSERLGPLDELNRLRRREQPRGSRPEA